MPILLENGEIDNYYYGFSNSIIWPLFHDLEALCRFQPQYWEAYVRVSDKFGCYRKAFNGKDIIWVNDYQLILLAAALSVWALSAIVCFSSYPFPSPDLLLNFRGGNKLLMSCYGFLFSASKLIEIEKFYRLRQVFYPACRVVGRGAIVELEIKGNYTDRKFAHQH